MKKQLLICSSLCLLLAALPVQAANYRAFYSSRFDNNEIRFIFFGSSAVVINAAKGTVLIDPGSLLGDSDIAQLKAGGLDLVLFTHSHGDHYNTATALKILNATGASFLVERLVAGSLSGKIPEKKLTVGLPGKHYRVGDIKVDVIAGVHLGPINLYRIKIGDITIFHGGDSAHVPLKKYPSTIAFLPTGAPSPTCSPEYAFQMALDLRPKVVVPMHGGSHEHAELKNKVVQNLSDATVIIPVTQVLKKVAIPK